MTTWPILSVVTFLPVIGALAIYLTRGDDEAARRNARWIALWTTLVTFAVSLILVWRFDAAEPDFQFVEKANWLASGITYHMGVDGISLPFVILTTALMPFCIIASWKSITMRVREYMMAFLLLETLMVGTFSALDLVLFYLFFEGGLIPMFLIIGVWGGPRRVYASLQVLPLHAARLGADAARDHGAVLECRHHRHPDPDAHRGAASTCRPGRGWRSLPPLR